MQKLKFYTRQVWRSKFARNVAVVASGTAAAQIITFAFMPIITRLYGPETFGILGAFNAILLFMVPMAAMSYPIAIVLPKRDEIAKGIVRLSIKISFVTSFAVALLLLFAGEKITSTLNIGAASSFLWFIPLNMLFSVWLATATQWVVRKSHFNLKAKVAVVNALVQNLLKVGIGGFAPYFWVLITIVSLGNVLNAGLLYFGFRKKQRSEANIQRSESDEEPNLSSLKLADKYSDFAYFRTPQVVLNSASQSLPVLMLTALFDPATAGFYVLGRMTISAPTQLLGKSVGTVFYPHFNAAVIKGLSGTPILIRATISLAAIGFLPFLFVVITGPWLFELIFGIEWRIAGEFASWMAIWLFVGFINQPSVAALPVLKLQGFYLLYEVLAILLRAVALYLGYSTFGTAHSAIISFSIVSVFLNAILITFTCVMSKRIDKAKMI